MSKSLLETMQELDESMDNTKKYRERKDNALFETAEALRQMNAKMDEEKATRIKAEFDAKKERRINHILTIVAVTIGLLTLIATVLLGILGLLH